MTWACPPTLLRDTGLAFTNKVRPPAGLVQGSGDVPDLCRRTATRWRSAAASCPARPIRRSTRTPSETYIYAKSKTLYGLNWAKGDIVAADQVIVCEGYTDVIGFHRAGVKRAVATCGTALTEEHVRMLKRFASRVVLAFDADAAGQGAADKFYEWEQKYQVQVSVAAFPEGQGSGRAEPVEPCGAGRRGRHGVAVPRLPAAAGDDRPAAAFAGGSGPPGRAGDGGGQRASRYERAQAVRRPGGQSHRPSDQRPGGDRIAAVGAPDRARRHRPPCRAARRTPSSWRSPCSCSAGTTWPDGSTRCCSSTTSPAGRFWRWPKATASVGRSLELADPEARELIERAAVADIDADPAIEGRNLIAAAVRRELARPVDETDPVEILRQQRRASGARTSSTSHHAGNDAAELLLGWLQRRNEERE